ncbi:Uncharacterised protein [Acinetobacter baumannii]|nr:Uncharacterised protein [Acinetobacter baumannii]
MTLSPSSTGSVGLTVAVTLPFTRSDESIRPSLPSLITTLGAFGAVVSPIVESSLPSGDLLPALSVTVAVTSTSVPSAGLSNSTTIPLLLMSSLFAASTSTSWVEPSGRVIVTLSPSSTGSVGLTVAVTLPFTRSVGLITPSSPSLITTLGAVGAVVSPTFELSLPSGDLLPALSVTVAVNLTSVPSAGLSNSTTIPLVLMSSLFDPSTTTSWVEPFGSVIVTLSPSSTGSVGLTVAVTLPFTRSDESIRPSLPSLITTLGAFGAVVSPIVESSLPSGDLLPALSVTVAVTSTSVPSAGLSNSTTIPLLLMSSLFAASTSTSWVEPSGRVIVTLSPSSTGSVGLTVAVTLPFTRSVGLITPSPPSLITTLGAVGAVVSFDSSSLSL